MSNFLYWEFAAPTQFEGLQSVKTACLRGCFLEASKSFQTVL
jgi:hypothetical protein